ncbi:LytTR family DNA-binding domain-containing protein [Rudaea sp.]|uniref:LytTR family DNA-binding domain-containing protein n=1 Tax=Rudaea sp. TaxID=2136325 RepID=UPI00321FB992
MPTVATSSHERTPPWRRWVESGFWPVLLALNAVANAMTATIEVRRHHLGIAEWEPWVWEISSSLVVGALIPGIAAFARRFPLHWGAGWLQLRLHLLASLVFSLIHVVGMVALRMLAYRALGGDYDFGPWPIEMFYEYLKDVRSYALIVLAIEAYRFVLRRSQGEASLLTVPDEGTPVEPVDKPERFLVRKLGREFLVNAADIEWAQAQGNYVNLHVGEREYPLRSTIAGVEERLDPRRFARVHRSYLVNLDCIASIEALDTGDARLHMRGGAMLPCSRRYRPALRERIGGEVAASA